MSIFKRRPQLQNFEPISPPCTEVLHAYDEEPASESERSAKRRRINEYVKDYLKGREVFIATAALKGPFDNGWKNPWRVQSKDETNAFVTPPEEACDLNIEETEPRKVIPETEARPVSRAGPDYCHDWLRRQDKEGHSPDLDDEFDVEIRTGDEITPSRRAEKRHRKKPRLDVDPAWSPDPPALTDQPVRLNSLQVNYGSSVTKRSLSEQSNQRDYRDRFRRKQHAANDTTMTKVSMIQDDLPQRRLRPHFRAKTKAVVEAPDFPFRRVGNGVGKRPISRGSNHSGGSTTQREPPGQDENIWAAVSHLHRSSEVPVQIDEPMQDDIMDHSEDENAEADDEELVVMRVDAQGKWPCPMQPCPKRPRPYASASGLRKHLRAKHEVKRTVTGASHVPKQTVQPRKKSPKLALDIPEPAMVAAGESLAVVDAVGEEDRVTSPKALEPAQENPTKKRVLPAKMESPKTNESAHGSLQEREPPPQTGPAAVLKLKHTIANMAPPLRPLLAQAMDIEHDSVIPADTLNTSGDSGVQEAVRRAEQESRTEPAVALTSTDLLPNRQNSRAYPTFTTNTELSTQAALLQAHQAFQDTQSPEKPISPIREPATISGNAANAVAAGASQQAEVQVDATPVMPFRKPDMPSFFAKSQRTSLSHVVPPDTQELINAAAELEWSTAKKATQRPPVTLQKEEKKHISFADWKQSKPSQMAGMKPIEWSPLIETPVSGLPTKERNAASQPQDQTPIKSAFRKTSMVKKTSALSFSHTYSSPAVSFSMDLDTPVALDFANENENEQFAQVPKASMDASAPSAVPVPSFEPGQGNLGSRAEINDDEVEKGLDEMESFLSTWNQHL